MDYSKNFADFVTFSKVYIEIGDADPTYPVLKKLCQKFQMDLEQRIEFCFWYMCWYNLRSAIEAYLMNNMTCKDITPELANLPIKLERRGLRGGKNIIRHWESQQEQVRKAEGWIRWAEQNWYRMSRGGPFYGNWQETTKTIQGVWNNGRWAAYKGCELLQKVCELNLDAPDMGHANSSNPRRCLNLLFKDLPPEDDNSGSAIKTLDEVSKLLMLACIEAEVPVDHDMALLETCCCGFWSLHRGDYYLGCDLDLMLEVAMEKDDNVRRLLLDARCGCFDMNYMGELGGWYEHDKPRLKLYRDQGIIATR